TLGGGFGGRFTKDGKDGVQVHITNTSNLPVESIEMEYPLLVESYGFVPDSGGAGKHRGGLGLRRVVRPVGHTMTFSGQGERFVRSEEHTSELQSQSNLVCRLLLEKKKKKTSNKLI